MHAQDHLEPGLVKMCCFVEILDDSCFVFVELAKCWPTFFHVCACRILALTSSTCSHMVDPREDGGKAMGI